MWAWEVVIDKITIGVFCLGICIFSVVADDSKDTQWVGNRLPSSRGSSIHQFDVRKKKMAVPKAKLTIEKIKQKTIKVAEPPRQFRRYFKEGTDEAELDRVINEEINQLFNLLKTSRRRDLRLRLGSLYVEKAHLIEYQLYEEYDRQMKDFEQGNRKSKPRLKLRPTYVFIDKSIKLFETYRRQYPKDRRMDQVLFFLGVSYSKRNRLSLSRSRYEELVKRFPKSGYIHDVYFELGEYHFNQSQWIKASKYYLKIVKSPRSKLYPFALYKLAWCRFNMGMIKKALAYLTAVIQEGSNQKTDKSVGVSGAGRMHFAKEATNDLPLFYSRSRRSPIKAFRYFYNVSDSSKTALKMLRQLAYAYLDRGHLKGVRITFKQLINEDPFSPEAYEYQYQIIRAYTYAGSRKFFLQELKSWLHKYNPKSNWADHNSNRPDLIQKASKLLEVTIRNYALRMHKNFNKTKDPSAKNQTLFGYETYNKFFKKSKLADQMYFFHAELLFDLKEYRLASKKYMYVMENFKNSQYYETAALNGVLALEKTLPSFNWIRKRVKNKKSYVAFTRPIDDFHKVAHSYISRFPKKSNVPAILYKTAVLHYEFNHYQEAKAQFWQLVKRYPKSSYMEYAANSILDIYNFQKDFEGLRKAAILLLKNPIIAKSSLAKEMRKMLSTIALKNAENLSNNKQYLESARLYKSYADTHLKSPSRVSAYYNAGVNFKKGKDLLNSIKLYNVVLNSRSKEVTRLKMPILKELPELYRQTGQYRKSAHAFSVFARSYPQDPSVANFWYNAALIHDGLNQYSQAKTAYLEYFRRSQKSDKAQALYLLAEMMKRYGKPQQAVSYYNQFLNKGSANHKTLVESAFNIAEIKKARGDIASSKKWYRKTINIYRKYKVGVFYAAQAQFNFVYDNYLDFKKIKIPSNPKRQKQVVQKKLNLFNKLKEDLKGVIRFDSGHQVVASLVLIGLASQHIGEAIYYSPLPKGLNKQEIARYRQALMKTALPFRQEAIKNYNLAVQKSKQLNAYNMQWLKIAIEQLSFFKKAPIVKKPFLRKLTLPVFLIDWSGV